LVFKAAVAPAFSVTLIFAVLNPGSEIVTSYLPGARSGNEYAPDAFVIWGGSFSPVASFVTTTVAPGTTPPVLSRTTPEIVAATAPVCALVVD
jgi:hypothetical protein